MKGIADIVMKITDETNLKNTNTQRGVLVAKSFIYQREIRKKFMMIDLQSERHLK